METFGVAGDIGAVMDERRTALLEKYATDLALMDGFLDFYTALAQRNIAMCVATACEDQTLVAVDRKVGLAELFGKNIFKLSDVGNRSKPDPAIFLYAADQMRAPRETCVVIEDSPNGVQAARNAGIRCIAITTTHGRKDLPGADIIVDAFSDIDLALFGETDAGTSET